MIISNDSQIRHFGPLKRFSWSTHDFLAEGEFCNIDCHSTITHNERSISIIAVFTLKQNYYSLIHFFCLMLFLREQFIHKSSQMQKQF